MNKHAKIQGGVKLELGQYGVTHGTWGSALMRGARGASDTASRVCLIRSGGDPTLTGPIRAGPGSQRGGLDQSDDSTGKLTQETRED